MIETAICLRIIRCGTSLEADFEDFNELINQTEMIVLSIV